ncbi:OTU domain-containing protein 6B [Lojkania enalia]|uniref:OTU domain-containing protein 6B n=1 Tax=Lojkania enalia TaxID=147567 RepID=A0A9P4K417_9PLEO|nr:OTU domain-containing protein 6B [Didymosphaeria enalia]
MDAPESLEALQARHRKEQRDLVARLTQKKKSATKKTRKGINDECDRLEQELKERQAQELATLTGENLEESPGNEGEPEEQDDGRVNGLKEAVEGLSISSPERDGTAHPAAQANGPKKKPNRTKARLARRAAEQEALATQAADEAANLPDLREQERARMKEYLGKHGLQEKEIRADGHCLYSAVADQMEMTGLDVKPRILPKINVEDGVPAYKIVRHAAAGFIEQNPDDFVPFMEEPLEQYLKKIRETGEWGGHMELIALAKTYGVQINVLHGDGRVDKIEPEGANSGEGPEEIWLGYYKHNFGLGEHYNSLRKTP